MTIQIVMLFSPVSILPYNMICVAENTLKLTILEFMDSEDLYEFEMDRWMGKQMGRDSP